MTSRPALDIRLVSCLFDNYAYLLRDTASGSVAVVDPAESAPVEAALKAAGWGLDWIMLTHHHHDHTDGVPALRAAYGARVVGARADAARLPAPDAALAEGDIWSLGASAAQIIDVSGHTIGHIAYHFTDAKALFCGDSLFSLGCGRVFEGSFEQMRASLNKLAALPGDTRVYCGHEYTLSNARFAAVIEADSPTLAARIAEVETLRAAGRPTIPSTIAQERATNPFLRVGETAIKTALGAVGAPDAEIFAKLRRKKDAF